MKTRTVFIALDGSVFLKRGECIAYERDQMKTVKIPESLLREAIRQATPYMVTAKERRELAERLGAYLPK